MHNHSHSTDSPPRNEEYGSFRSYGLGFVWSIVLTLVSYVLVAEKMLSGAMLGASIGLLAMIQAFMQLALFLNLWKEPKPRWNILIFFFMVMVVVILVFGSIWIMNNLNYNLMSE